MSDLRDAKPWLIYVLLGCSLATNVMLLLARGASDKPDSHAIVQAPIDAAGSAAPVNGSAAATGAVHEAAVQPASGQAVPSTAPTAGWTVLRSKVEQSLARTFQLAGGESGDALASVYTRLFVWDLELRRDLQAGDSIAVVWRHAPDGLPEIAAASLQSEKLGRTVAAYHWQAPGDPFPSYWHLDGTEAPLRLRDGPLAQYEQITSVLKDRPTHKGMDFKTPVGTPVSAPRPGTVTRVNWNWTANGNCVEIRYDDGVLGKFLHLSENRVAEGARVSVGQVIALTGNTGHSTAPHLHYQLNRGEKTIDPLDYHGTIRRSLNAEQIAAMRRDVAGFESMLAEPAVR